MDTGFARSGVSSEGNEGTVGNVEKNTVMRTDQVAEERDLVGVYLHEISRTPLLDAAKEVELSKACSSARTFAWSSRSHAGTCARACRCST